MGVTGLFHIVSMEMNSSGIKLCWVYDNYVGFN